MKRETLEQAIRQVVEVTFKNGEVCVGWLMPSYYREKEFEIYPYRSLHTILTFKPSFVKQIKYIETGVILK